MKKILLLFVLFLGLSVGLHAGNEVESFDTPDWKIFYNKDGSMDVVKDGSPCWTQYEENDNGDYIKGRVWCP